LVERYGSSAFEIEQQNHADSTYKKASMTQDLLLTVSIGQDELARHTIPRMERYAQQHGVDFRVVSSSSMFQRATFAYWEELLNLVDSAYHRIIVLDSDILIRRGAPNLFDVPFNGIAMKPSGRVGADFLKRIRSEIAEDFQVADMYNTGVVMISQPFLKSIAQHLREYCPRVENTRYADQVYFCVIVKRSGVCPTHLPWRWNQHDQVPNFRASLAHFLHFFGPNKVERVERFLQLNIDDQEWSLRS
jgi:lipopolysaccharide biosynthesis glycosyltransferase